LEPVLHPAKEAVRIFHVAALLGGQAADLLEPRDRRQRVAMAHLRRLPAVEELEELDDELDVADAAAADLDLDLRSAGREGPLLDPPFHRLDLADLGTAQVTAIDERRDRVQEGMAQLEVAGDRAALDQRLALPGSPRGLVVAQRPGQRA